MAVALPLDKMSIEEKLQTMESIWEDLCRSADSISSPPWHMQIIDEREESVKQGKDKFIDWDEAKEHIKRKTK